MNKIIAALVLTFSASAWAYVPCDVIAVGAFYGQTSKNIGMPVQEFEYQLIKLSIDNRISKEERDLFAIGLRFGYTNGLEGTQPEFQALVAKDFCEAGKLNQK